MEICSKCVYCKYPKIGASTPFKADVAIVGEAPGATEIAHRTPFIGPSGQLLDKVLEATHMPPRREIFVTNALLCKPPNNKPQIRTAVETCQSRLLAELDIVQPKVIVALGNIAMHSLTGDFKLKITAEQGRILRSPYLPDTKIVPVLHPAAVLRAPGDYKLFYSALVYASNLIRGQKPADPGEVQWTVIETQEQLTEAIAVLQDCEVVACDIETTGLDPRRDEVLVVGIAYAKNKVFVIPKRMLSRELFEIKGLQWCWHNGKFDTSFLRRRGFPAIVHHDTLLLSYCLNEHGGIHGLEQLSTRLLGAQSYKHIANRQARKTKKGFAGLSKDTLYERVATDTDYTLQCLHKILPEVESNKRLKNLYCKLLLPASAFLRRVERNGMYIYKPLLNELKHEYQSHLNEIHERIVDMAMPFWDPELYMRGSGAKTAPEVFNPGSPKQLAWLLFDRLRLKPGGRSKGRSTNKEVLERMKGMHPIIEAMLEYRSVSKELSTYIVGTEKYITIDGRVHTTYKLHGTTTGRLSSSEPNVQNQPKRKPRVRNIFQAPPNRWLLEADYKGAELRVLAEMSKDEFLMNCFLQGRDLHTEVAEALGIPRIRAKAINFGIPYGRSEYTLSDELEISIDEARGYIQDWFKRAPNADKFLDWCARAPLEGRTLVTPLGRHRRFGLVTPENLGDLQNEARNFIIQSLASDFTLISAMRAEGELRALGVKIINLVHDSILMELPQDKKILEHAISILQDVMRRVPIEEVNARVPFEADFQYGTTWGALEEVE